MNLKDKNMIKTTSMILVLILFSTLGCNEIETYSLSRTNSESATKKTLIIEGSSEYIQLKLKEIKAEYSNDLFGKFLTNFNNLKDQDKLHTLRLIDFMKSFYFETIYKNLIKNLSLASPEKIKMTLPHIRSVSNNSLCFEMNESNINQVFFILEKTEKDIAAIVKILELE